MVQRLHDNRITALYCRLSRDDGYADDSCSIDSQKSMLREYAINEGFDRCEFFVDDGFSGTNFDRPDFSRMIDMIEHNMVGTLVVKDLSRLGREYLRTGYYTEIIFPMHDVRFIAINDGVDSANGENEFAPFKNLLNEMYAKDISRKIKSSIRTRTKRGEYVNGKPPYGYMRDPDNRNHLIPDRNTAPTVKRMYSLALEGKSSYAISVILRDEETPKPTAYVLDRNGGFHVDEKCEYPYEWCPKTIRDILSNVTYIGHLYAGMTAHRSFKDKHKVIIPEDQWIKRMNDHEPIIDEETFYKVQILVNKSHKVYNFLPEANIYKGLCFCGDCGHIMWFTARPERKTEGYYTCGRSRLRHNKRGCSAHYTTLEYLNSLVLGDIKRISKKITSGKKAFIKKLIETAENEYSETTGKIRKEIEESNVRIEELGILTRKLYEDRVFGRITDEVYLLLSSSYEKELNHLTEKVTELSRSIPAARITDAEIRSFVELIERIADIKEMTIDIAHELIDHIVVYNHASGNEKKVDIYYRFVGKMSMRRRT